MVSWYHGLLICLFITHMFFNCIGIKHWVLSTISTILTNCIWEAISSKEHKFQFSLFLVIQSFAVMLQILHFSCNCQYGKLLVEKNRCSIGPKLGSLSCTPVDYMCIILASRFSPVCQQIKKSMEQCNQQRLHLWQAHQFLLFVLRSIDILLFNLEIYNILLGEHIFLK